MMQVIEQVLALRSQIMQWKQAGLSIAFVPTMGNLHAGHLSLVALAKQSADKVVVSIFVNPLQFGEHEDLAQYPRTFAEDKALLVQHQVDVLFFPSVAQMYPQGQAQTLVTAPERLTTILEGAVRPGHFDGVTTVVAKLLNMVQPDFAVFGQKDLQQYRVIETMVKDLALPVTLLMGEIVREADGLALSSRNQYLTAEQRQIAPKLWVTLQDVALAIQSGNSDFEALQRAATQQLLGEGFDAVDYVQIVSVEDLLPCKASFVTAKSDLAILAVAKCGSTRLLDNILL